MKNLFIFIILAFSFSSVVLAQGQVGGEPDEEETIRLTREQIKDFKQLDELSKKLIEVVEDRWFHCRLEEVKIKNLSDLYERLGGYESKVVDQTKCTFFSKSKNPGNRCLIKYQAHRTLDKMLKNKSIILYLKIRLNVDNSEAKGAARFLDKL